MHATRFATTPETSLGRPLAAEAVRQPDARRWSPRTSRDDFHVDPVVRVAAMKITQRHPIGAQATIRIIANVQSGSNAKISGEIPPPPEGVDRLRRNSFLPGPEHAHVQVQSADPAQADPVCAIPHGKALFETRGSAPPVRDAEAERRDAGRTSDRLRRRALSATSASRPQAT